MFQYILNRLKERSTWLGLIAFATSCGASIATELTESIITVGVALLEIRGFSFAPQGGAGYIALRGGYIRALPE